MKITKRKYLHLFDRPGAVTVCCQGFYYRCKNSVLALSVDLIMAAKIEWWNGRGGGQGKTWREFMQLRNNLNSDEPVLLEFKI